MSEISPPLIYVWIGSKLPDWGFTSLELTRSYSPARKMILIVDKEPGNAARFAAIGVEVRVRSQARDRKKFETLSTQFRGGFWRYTSERFECLAEYSREFSVGRFFHAELDNIVFGLDGLSDVLDQVGEGVFSPRDNAERAIGSLIYVNRSESVEEVVASYQSDDPPGNDMIALGRYLNDSKYGHALPTEAALSRQANWAYVDARLCGGIFDAAAIGQYLLGVDPRNQPYRPVRNLFRNENNLIDFRRLVFRADEGGLYVASRHGAKEYRILNLHVHSKAMKKARELLQGGSLVELINTGKGFTVVKHHRAVTGPFLRAFKGFRR